MVKFFVTICLMLLLGITPAMAMPEIMTTEQIKPGMQGYAETMVQGNQKVRFNVEIMGVVNNGGGSEVTTRLFGNFLTWMQEKESPVFVVATANNIMNLPPELMRKGRFDEIFFVGLPNRTERRKIFEIHINKRRKNDMQYVDINKLVDLTEGYSGADIEGVVKDAIEDVFASDKDHITTDDIVKMIENTHSLSEIMKEPLEKMNKEYKERKFKNASK